MAPPPGSAANRSRRPVSHLCGCGAATGRRKLLSGSPFGLGADLDEAPAATNACALQNLVLGLQHHSGACCLYLCPKVGQP